MPQFTFSVRDREGGTRGGTMEASDRDSAVRSLVEQGLIVTQLTQIKPTSGVRAMLAGARTHINSEERLSFTQSIAAMLDAGITLAQAVGLLATEAESPQLRRIMVRVDSQLSQGTSLSSALKEFPKSFNRLYVAMVEAGEASGKLPECLTRLGAYLEEAAELEGKVKAGLLYPAFIVAFAIVMVITLMMFAIPRLEAVYAGMAVQLPPPTLVVIFIGRFLANYWLLWIPAVFVAGFGLMKWAQSPGGRRTVDRFKLDAPLLGTLFRRLAIARFSRTLGTLYGAGIPMAGSLDVVAKTMDNVVLEQAVLRAKDSLLKGESLASQLRESQVFTSIAASMIAVGEETGGLDKMLDKLANYYETQVQIALKALLGMIEPVLIVCVGAVIGGMIMCIALPFMQLATVLQ